MATAATRLNSPSHGKSGFVSETGWRHAVHEVESPMRIHAPSALAAAVAFATVAAQEQFKIGPVTTFGTNGWLPPNGVNGSPYAYLTTGDTERGLACGNNHLYVVSRNGGDFVRILDSQTGADLGALNLGTNVVNRGTFDVNLVAVGSDGSIYVANLVTGQHLCCPNRATAATDL
jgi:hypothetical protein